MRIQSTLVPDLWCHRTQFFRIKPQRFSFKLVVLTVPSFYKPFGLALGCKFNLYEYKYVLVVLVILIGHPSLICSNIFFRWWCFYHQLREFSLWCEPTTGQGRHLTSNIISSWLLNWFSKLFIHFFLSQFIVKICFYLSLEVIYWMLSQINLRISSGCNAIHTSVGIPGKRYKTTTSPNINFP